MGTAERRERERLQRQNDILDAAEKVIFKRGLKEATIDEIAEAAEVSKGSIYLNFKNKESIFMGISARALNLLRSKFLAAIEGRSSGLERVRAIGEVYIDFAFKYPDYYKVIAFYEALEPEEMERLHEDPLGSQCHEAGMGSLAILAEAIGLGITDGTVRPELNPMRAAFFLWGSTTGVLHLSMRRGAHMLETVGMTEQELLEDFMAMSVESIAARPNNHETEPED